MPSKHCTVSATISIPALREEGDRAARKSLIFSMPFLSPPSARRATGSSERWTSERSYFYPRPPRGGRHKYNAKCTQINLFLSPPSARRATTVLQFVCQRHNISIPALREEGDAM